MPVPGIEAQIPAMNRLRSFIPFVVGACFALQAADPIVAADDPPSKQPNIIFLMDDQHRCDHLGVLDPTVKTPALDRLAANGILFDQAVCQAPMCVPSRYSFMLGLYPPQSAS